MLQVSHTRVTPAETHWDLCYPESTCKVNTHLAMESDGNFNYDDGIKDRDQLPGRDDLRTIYQSIAAPSYQTVAINGITYRGHVSYKPPLATVRVQSIQYSL